MAIAVEGELDGRVAETLLDLFRVRPLGDEQRSTDMTQIVESKGW